MTVVLRAVVAPLLAVGLSAQHRVWRINAPAAGPFGEQVAVIGDRDGDGHADVVRPVGLPIPYPWPLSPYAWTFSGRTGQLLTMGPLGAWMLVTAGDINRDNCGDYIMSGVGAFLPSCAPWQCLGFDAHSGMDDSVLWHVDLPRLNSLGTMAIGDLDLDGDDVPDALIGTNQAANGVLFAISSRGTVLYQVVGLPGAHFGPGLGKFIDYNQDGCDDFLLGIYVAPNGAVDIRSGVDGSLLRRLPGPQAIAGYGATAAMTGDMDGDGIADVIAGDSSLFSPGVIAVLGSVSGVVLHQWQVNQIGSVGHDDFGYPDVASTDVDRDGFEDVIANSRAGNVGQFIFSGRDGSLIEHYFAPNDYVVGGVEVMPPQMGDPFPRYACHGASNTVTGMHLFSGAPQGVERTGIGSPGTLPTMPVLGLRALIPTGFRATLSGAESGAFVILVVGFSQPTLPFFDLSLLGFTGSYLYPQPDLVGFFQAGSAWPNSGYVAHDFPQSLVAATTPGALTAYLQWIVFGSGPSWPGGVSEAMRIHVQ